MIDTNGLQFDVTPPAGEHGVGREASPEGKNRQEVRDALEKNTGRWALLATWNGPDAKEDANLERTRISRGGFSFAVRETAAGQWSLFGRHTGIIRKRTPKPDDVENDEEVEPTFQ